MERALSPDALARLLRQARQTTLDLVGDLTDEQMLGPKLRIVNPPLWEIGHVAWFQERWALRHLRGFEPIRPDGDILYDSAAVAHDTRWTIPLPPRSETLAFMQRVLDRVTELLGEDPLPEDGAYFHQLALLHEYMHDEALAYTRHTLAYPAPVVRADQGSPAGPGEGSWHDSLAADGPDRSTETVGTDGRISGDVEVPGGTFTLGAIPDEHFVFDNERWAHPVEVRPFRIARTAVSNEEFAAFVDDGGYRDRRWWSADGWRWRENTGAEHPVYWRREAPGRWQRRSYDSWQALEPRLPVLHVSWFEAEAYCAWAGRRLPTEAEWEMAASAEPLEAGMWRKRRYPWGNDSPSPERANLDLRRLGVVDVDALPAGDSYFGCRQMVGNVWEWTATTFYPYPGFVRDPYKEYSQPWFGDHKVLRGGCWATRSLLIRNTWRNFYTPDRRDVWAGFRTCPV